MRLEGALLHKRSAEASWLYPLRACSRTIRQKFTGVLDIPPLGIGQSTCHLPMHDPQQDHVRVGVHFCRAGTAKPHDRIPEILDFRIQTN
jgi:hypothetical protein